MNDYTRKNDRGVIVFENYHHEVADYKIGGVTFVNKFGKTPALSNSDNFPVWDKAEVYPFVTSGTQVTITSDDNNDGVGNTGAQSVIISGLLDDYTPNSEEIAMSGTSSGTYRRVFRAIVEDVGSNGVNVGNISVNHGANVVAQISAGKGQTLMAIYTIASGVTGHLINWSASVVADDGTQNKAGDFEIYSRKIGKSKRVRDAIGLRNDKITHKYDFPITLEEMTDIWIEVTSKSASTKVTAGFEIEMNDNEINSKFL